VESAHELYCNFIRHIGEAGAKYPLGADAFVSKMRPLLASLVDVLYAASQASEDHAAEVHSAPLAIS